MFSVQLKFEYSKIEISILLENELVIYLENDWIMVCGSNEWLGRLMIQCSISLRSQTTITLHTAWLFLGSNLECAYHDMTWTCRQVGKFLSAISMISKRVTVFNKMLQKLSMFRMHFGRKNKQSKAFSCQMNALGLVSICQKSWPFDKNDTVLGQSRKVSFWEACSFDFNANKLQKTFWIFIEYFTSKLTMFLLEWLQLFEDYLSFFFLSE